VSGKKYAFAANRRKLEAITLESDCKDGQTTLVARFDGVERRIVCGPGKWQKGRGAWAQFAEQPLAASGAWTEDDTFTARVCFYETPFVLTVTLKFAGDELRFNSEQNVGFGSMKDPQLVGKAE
jgi:hypothetical protein